MSVGIGQVWLRAVVEFEQHRVSAKPANYIGDAHFFGFVERVAKNDDIEGFAFADGKHLMQIVGLGDTMSASFEVDAPGREQRAIEADI